VNNQQSEGIQRSNEFAKLAVTSKFLWQNQISSQTRARAQQSAMPVVGFINGASPAPRNFAAFVQGLKEAGFVDSQNVLIEARWAEGNYARLPALVEELIGRHVALICATGGLDPARTAQTATATIPIVFVRRPCEIRDQVSNTNLGQFVLKKRLSPLWRRRATCVADRKCFPSVSP
jgi:ABC-type uncharacterized transport system substrate-binding protein